MNFRNDIQILRAIAVISVMAFHFNPAMLPGGFVGVDIFLVISGYLITSILIKRQNADNYNLLGSVKYFYTSRFKRIVPAYISMLILVAITAAVFFIPSDFNIFNKGLKKALWFNSNNYFAGFGNYFAPANHEQPLLHTWSLAIEIQFYLLAPFIVLFIPRRFLAVTLITVSIVLLCIAEYKLRIQNIHQQTYYSLYARLPEFFIGALAALYLSKKSAINSKVLPLIGLLLIITSVIFQPDIGPFPGFLVLLPTIGTALILISDSQSVSQSVSQLFCNKLILWIGALSYSLYLWHWPVLAFLRYYTGAEVLSLNYALLFILLTLTLSTLSFYLIEEPMRGKATIKVKYLAYFSLISTV